MLPALERIARRVSVPISIDTCKVAVARSALDAGAEILNDVGMGDARCDLATVAAKSGAVFLAMHSRGTAATMGRLASYDDVVTEVSDGLSEAARVAESNGVPRSRVILDPGIGFAKNGGHSLSLLVHLGRLRELGYPLCVGVSRKSFMVSPEAHPAGWVRDASPPLDRVGGSAAALAVAVLHGASLLRVHDVAVMRQAARVAHAIGGAR